MGFHIAQIILSDTQGNFKEVQAGKHMPYYLYFIYNKSHRLRLWLKEKFPELMEMSSCMSTVYIVTWLRALSGDKNRLFGLWMRKLNKIERRFNRSSTALGTLLYRKPFQVVLHFQWDKNKRSTTG